MEASKRPEPVFVPPPNSIQVKRVAHSEVYLRYIESLYGGKRKAGSEQPGSSNGVSNGQQAGILRQRSVSKWEKALGKLFLKPKSVIAKFTHLSSASTQRNTPAPPPQPLVNTITGTVARRSPYDWIRSSAGGSKQREDEIIKALWKLREQLVEGTTEVQTGVNGTISNGAHNGFGEH